MKIEVTKEDLNLIYNALNSHAARLRDYADAYRRNGDAENTKDCLKEAFKCYDLSDKICKAGAK